MATYKKIALGVVLVLVILPGGVLLLYSRQAICYCQVRKLARECPEVALVPKPLSDHAPNSGPGMTLSRYQFELP